MRALLTLAAAVVWGAGCSNSEVPTSVFLEVRNGPGAPMPNKVEIVFYRVGPDGGAVGSPLRSKENDVGATAPDMLLGTIVVLPPTGDLHVHVRGRGLVTSRADPLVSQGDLDLTFEAGKQVTATLTLASVPPAPDGGDGGVTDAGDVDGQGTDADAGDIDASHGDASGDAMENPDGAITGTACTSNNQCRSGRCIDDVCCATACAGPCHTCAPDGTCRVAAKGTNPRGACIDKGAGSCMTTGACNDDGTCQLYLSGTACSRPTMCSADNASVISAFACDGRGGCVPSTIQSCHGFVCANAACPTTCAADSACAANAFCSASSCVTKPVNLAGNGDAEYGTTAGWGGSPPDGPSSTLSNPAAGGAAHTGMYGIIGPPRRMYYTGPGYYLPTGLGRYDVSVWVMQNQSTTVPAVLNVSLACRTTTQYVVVGAFGTSLPKGAWVNIAGTVDYALGSADCLPTASPPGLVKQALLYVNQDPVAAPTPVMYPDIYMDDVSVVVLDSHNLVGNPNFESGFVSGWSVRGTGTLAISTAAFSQGARSLQVSMRSATTSGPQYALPLGAAKYNVTFHAMHGGTAMHTLSLAPAYTCLGSTATVGAPAVSSAAIAANTWVTLTGSVTLPPANAAAGCRMVQADVVMHQEPGTCGTGAGQVECPDLYVDDVSISVAP